MASYMPHFDKFAFLMPLTNLTNSRRAIFFPTKIQLFRPRIKNPTFFQLSDFPGHPVNKLRKARICWTTQKIKANLAAQSFSASVADALEYCRDGLHLLDFQNVQGPVRFLRFVNHLFDVLNSRNQKRFSTSSL
ncbi:THAP domain containing 9 [Plakobranchus ocellatus]|uniref:THAP domain containing 9 n=1 Tax=Plakobranchus ocellatus TaxID=259542 RepID=A0AAV4B333_9GAST|nr:THAP domain containing 9 [Plakobranchus ocellatus]